MIFLVISQNTARQRWTDRAVMQALLDIDSNAYFLLSGTGQAARHPGMSWGNGFVTDLDAIKQFNLSDPFYFFRDLSQAPRLLQRTILSPHVLGPGTTVSLNGLAAHDCLYQVPARLLCLMRRVLQSDTVIACFSHARSASFLLRQIFPGTCGASLRNRVCGGRQIPKNAGTAHFSDELPESPSTCLIGASYCSSCLLRGAALCRAGRAVWKARSCFRCCRSPLHGCQAPDSLRQTLL